MLQLAGLLVASAVLLPQWLASRRARAGQSEEVWTDEDRRAISDWMSQETLPDPAHDLSSLRAWALMAAVALGIGYMGAMSWHSRYIVAWLCGLAVCTLLMLSALDLSRHQAAQQRGDSLE